MTELEEINNELRTEMSYAIDYLNRITERIRVLKNDLVTEKDNKKYCALRISNLADEIKQNNKRIAKEEKILNKINKEKKWKI